MSILSAPSASLPIYLSTFTYGQKKQGTILGCTPHNPKKPIENNLSLAGYIEY